ncbi:hypothetical protein HGH93_21570 [Chitinophaga polysaccharea]|uniref:hypothetical protein n=1 Tax=Chitinophaga polysaccharea TaxID=1293035 RepID=UPI001455A02B|nr:hypothetical protein [Chitinophaga polysaccharea]NLR60714.1 hypothetical protein [Chitinophaga polysaccharea]
MSLGDNKTAGLELFKFACENLFVEVERLGLDISAITVSAVGFEQEREYEGQSIKQIETRQGKKFSSSITVYMPMKTT